MAAGVFSIGPEGDIVNVGGDAQQGRRLIDLAVRDFMAGEVELRTRLGLQVRVEPIRNWSVQAAYRRVNSKNVWLPVSGRGDALGQEWTATLDVNFY